MNILLLFFVAPRKKVAATILNSLRSALSGRVRVRSLWKMFCAILLILCIRFDPSLGIMNEMAIDINDIMSDKMMPTSFFVIEGSNSIDNATASSLFNNITSVLLPKNDGDFQSAYKLMKFHR